jgi:ferrous iron transport protein B
MADPLPALRADPVRPTALPVAPPAPEAPGLGVVLVGNPNVGKSVLFGALTGRYVTVSNYPGTTVEVTRGSMHLGGRSLPVVDTPGTASFLPASEDEQVTRDILLSGRPHSLVVVGDAKNLDRAVLLCLQLAEMETPHVLCLNMMDEAAVRGIRIDHETLARQLGIDVVPTVAVSQRGLAELRAAIDHARCAQTRAVYPSAIEGAVVAAADLLPETKVARRALALMVLAGDETLGGFLAERISTEAMARLEDLRQRLQRMFGKPLAYVIAEARLQAAIRLSRSVVSTARPSKERSASLRQLEQLTTHPLWGLPVLGIVLYAAYLFVGVFGAGTLVDLLEDGLFGRVISPAAVALADASIPWRFLRDLLVGPYGLVTMALAYSIALVLPIVGTFFVAFGLLEDSGYLPRLAVMVNRLFKKMGLNGRAVLPMVLGLGCDTMATLTTRVLETRKERLIVILLLALGVPCSAQLTVILALAGGLSPLALGIWASVVAGVMVLVGRLAAAVLPGRGSDLVLELPPLRLPRPGNILVKTLARIEWYLKEAVPLFVLGTLILFVADRLHALGRLERMAEPLLSGALGLPKETAAAFVVGFLRRDFGAAGLYRLVQEGRLDPVQIVVALVTLTLFIPCIANFFVIVKERGWRTGLAIAGFVFPFALGVGAVLNLILRAVPLPLR